MSEYFSHTSSHTVQYLKQVQALLDQLDPKAAPQAVLVPGSPVPRGGIIVFPGSFNPPTKAHLALLEQAQQFASHHGLMHVYAAISKHTTDKEKVERLLLLDRIILLQTLMRDHLPGTGIVLFNRGLYVEQAEAIRTAFPAVTRLLFLVGFDKIVQIFDPHYYDNRDAALSELFALAKLLVAPRGKSGEEELAELLHQPENQQFARYVHALPFDKAYRDISSSEVRQNPEAHRDVIPPEVQRFIDETYAYEPPVRQADGSVIDYYGEHIKKLEALLKGS